MTGLATFIQASAHSLPMLADGSVQTICTSPPFFGLRSYAGEQGVEWPAVTFRLNEWVEPTTVQPMTCGLGMEPSPVAYLAHLILCLREWRRVLHDMGVVFVNLGDSYASNGGSRDYGSSDGATGRGPSVAGVRRPAGGVKSKDLLMIPAMFAIAARADGWYLRSAIVWAKGVSFDPDYSGSVMPGSQQDRPTSAYENIFLLAKSPRYFYDNEAVKEAALSTPTGATGIPFGGVKQVGSNGNPTYSGNEYVSSGTRTLRNVWIVNPSPFKGAHFACWPEKLVEPMIKAGSRPGDVVLDPFSGSGTTAKVAVRLGRRAIGVDVSAEYLEGVTAQRFGAGVQMEMTV